MNIWRKSSDTMKMLVESKPDDDFELRINGIHGMFLPSLRSNKLVTGFRLYEFMSPCIVS